MERSFLFHTTQEIKIICQKMTVEEFLLVVGVITISVRKIKLQEKIRL